MGSSESKRYGSCNDGCYSSTYVQPNIKPNVTKKYNQKAIDKITALKKNPNITSSVDELLKKNFDKNHIYDSYFSSSALDRDSPESFAISVVFGTTCCDNSLGNVGGLVGQLVHTPPLETYKSAYVIVGTNMFGWTHESLVYVSKIGLYQAEIVLKLDPFNDVAYLEKVRDVIVDWNENKTYHRKSANCQHFVIDVLTSLNRYDDKVKQLLSIIKPLLKTYVLKYSFKDKYMENKKYFYSHQDLDEFFAAHLQHFKETKGIETDKDILEEYKKDQEDAYRIIKALDRAYWLQYLNATLKKEKKVPTSCCESSCPFGSPFITKSIPLSHNIQNSLVLAQNEKDPSNLV